jgi:hypothetical protein
MSHIFILPKLYLLFETSFFVSTLIHSEKFSSGIEKRLPENCLRYCLQVRKNIVNTHIKKSEGESTRMSSYSKSKDKAFPLQAWTAPEVSRKLRFPDFMTTAQDVGKVVSLTHRPPLPQEIHLILISVIGWVDPRTIVRPAGLCH